MVEFALIAPLFFTLIFAVVEFSLIHTAIDIMNFATKDAARIGSLIGRTDPSVDTQIVAAIRTRTAGVVIAKVTQIEVFKSDVTGGVTMVSGSPVEYVYDINGNNIGTTSWPVAQRRDTLLDADFLGVRVTYTYTYLTGFIAGAGATLTLTATSVQRIEPQDYQGYYGPPSVVANVVATAHPLALAYFSPSMGTFTPLGGTADRWRRPTDEGGAL
jgi:Flp pilus assembly protein TadG